ncbi:MAG: PadR family transcriptional regulator [Thermoplasmatota archaeon]
MKLVDGYRKKMEREMKSGLVSLLILSVIKRNKKPVYGYQIINELKRSTEGKLVLKEGSVYPILHYLQDQKFVVSFLDESPTGAPRKYYSITKLGEKAFREGYGSWIEFRDILNGIFHEEEGRK